MNILEFKNVHIRYGEDTKAVRGVSFSVPENAALVIVGESGSGKSTLIKAAIDLLPASGRLEQGQIVFMGKDMAELSADEKRKLRGRDIAMVFQDAGSYLNPRIKIGRQYMETLDAHMNISKEEKMKLAYETLYKLKLADADRIMNSYPFQLSGGMRQRVALAMAISMRPRLLLADEPTSALDVTVQAQVVKEILRLTHEMRTTVVMVTHNMGVASKIADYIAVMKDGVLMEFGKRDKIIFHPNNDYTKMLLEAVPKLETDELVSEQKNAHREKYRQMNKKG